MSRPMDRRSAPVAIPLQRSRRWLFWSLCFGTTLIGLWTMVGIVGASGITALEIAILASFSVTFAWIVVPFWTAIFGFGLQLMGRDPLTLAPIPRGAGGGLAPSSRTALVMPAYNEDPDRVMAGLRSMVTSLAQTGFADRFAVHLLSDSNDPVLIAAEEAAWEWLVASAGEHCDLRYRRRPANRGRKAGNVADFCQDWAGEYDLMVVLDADSIMDGESLVRLVQMMDANPDVGLIQTVPLPSRQETLFGRVIQFAAGLNAPMLALGSAFWHGDAGNYWGHNAIMRLDAFAEHCRLPKLSGQAPRGGEILSHDFVEAALLRRAGWKVYMMPWLGGSYEEVPSNILDFAKRDRRWAQGSLQHLRLVTSPGLHPASRTHFVMGAMGYVSSGVWLLMLVASTAYVLFPDLSTNPIWTGATTGLASWSPTNLVPLLGATVALLLTPKLLALLSASIQRRNEFGGLARLWLSGGLETLFAVILAPMMMLFHSSFVAGFVLGRGVEWGTQVRDGRRVGWGAAVRGTAWLTMVGVVWGLVTLYVSPLFFIWLTPIFVGLLLSAPFVALTSSPRLGAVARKAGLFLTPSETSVPVVLDLVAARGRHPTASPTGTFQLVAPAARAPRRRSASGAPRAGSHPGP